jgi:hypothetical protein
MNNRFLAHSLMRLSMAVPVAAVALGLGGGCSTEPPGEEGTGVAESVGEVRLAVCPSICTANSDCAVCGPVPACHSSWSCNKGAGECVQGCISGSCNPGNPCKSANGTCTSCVCNAPNLPDGTACPDDGNPCTADQCSGGGCSHPALPAGTPCSGGRCYNGSCCPGCWNATLGCVSGSSPSDCGSGGNNCVSCADGNPCTQDNC